MAPMNDVLSGCRTRIDEHLDRYLTLPEAPPRLTAAMRYAVFNGGKRIRPTLVYLATEALGGELDVADSAASAVEMIHAYSLIHDDLPSMDDDALRRGRPTCHIEFGEATAILAGDALQTLAFETVAADEQLATDTRVRLVRELARASGALGMVAGQMVDLESENVDIDGDTLEAMHRRKTGDLISTSVGFGATLTGAGDAPAAALQAFGYALGLAFQVRDDILDETGDTQKLGKQAGADRSRRKSTFVSLHGLNSAQAQLDDLRTAAIDALAPLGDAADKLRGLADFIAERDH